VRWSDGDGEEPWHADWDLGPDDEAEGDEDLFSDEEESSAFDEEDRSDDDDDDDDEEPDDDDERASDDDDDFGADDDDEAASEDDDDDDGDGFSKKKRGPKAKKDVQEVSGTNGANGHVMFEAAEAAPAEVGEPEEAVGSEDGEDGDKRRGRRRSKTIARKQMLRERRRMLALGTVPEIVDYERPHTRAECRNTERPCLYVSCRYHLYLDVNPVTGSIKLNFPDKEVWQLADTCALDVAERGGITLEEVGEIMNLTRERIRQVEVSGLNKLKRGDVSLKTFLDGQELDVGALVAEDAEADREDREDREDRDEPVVDR
jgi:hypothetical protein